jgi:hypothetical protein
MEAGPSCPICLSATPDTVVCWNSHALCGECYTTMMGHARSQNKKCAECREPMFKWGDGTQDPIAPAYTFQQLRERASLVFHALNADGSWSAVRRNAYIRERFPELWQGRRTFRIIPFRDCPQNLVDDPRDSIPPIEQYNPPARRRAPARPLAERRCSACGQMGHIRTNRVCPRHPRNNQ